MANSKKCSELCKLRICENQPQDDEKDDIQVMNNDVEMEELDFE